MLPVMTWHTVFSALGRRHLAFHVLAVHPLLVHRRGRPALRPTAASNGPLLRWRGRLLLRRRRSLSHAPEAAQKTLHGPRTTGTSIWRLLLGISARAAAALSLVKVPTRSRSRGTPPLRVMGMTCACGIPRFLAWAPRLGRQRLWTLRISRSRHGPSGRRRGGCLARVSLVGRTAVATAASARRGGRGGTCQLWLRLWAAQGNRTRIL